MITITGPASRLAQAAAVLLVVAAFGSLSVGIPLLLAGVGLAESWLPTAALVWGVASIVGAYGVLRLKPWAAGWVVATQTPVVIGLLAALASGARDGFVLLVAAISAGAILCTVAETTRRS